MSDSAAVDTPKCGAKRRAGGTCQYPAGYRTAHPGQGRCWRHGGIQKGGDQRLKHGRYSSVRHERIGQLYEKYRQDEKPLDLFDELAMLRAIARFFVEEHELHTEALLAWYRHWKTLQRALPRGLTDKIGEAIDKWEFQRKAQGEWTGSMQESVTQARDVLAMLKGEAPLQPPKKVTDVADAAGLFAEIGKMVERIERLRAANAISEPELNRIINAMGRVVDVLVADADLKAKIRDGWMQIVVR